MVIYVSALQHSYIVPTMVIYVLVLQHSYIVPTMVIYVSVLQQTKPSRSIIDLFPLIALYD
jgi:hypothetical protein